MLKWNRYDPDNLPEEFVSVLGDMGDDMAPFPRVRECYRVKDRFLFPALNAYYPIVGWAEMPVPD